MNLKNVFAAMTMALLLSGCKIEVTVPEGGTVVSVSGTYRCESGQVCYIDVADLLFDETFEVIVDDGYRFKGWLVQDRGLCGGSTVNCRLYTSAFEGVDVLLAFLPKDDEVFYLQPVFDNGIVWIVNTTNESSQHIYTNGVAAPVNVQSVDSANDYTIVAASGIPAYQTQMTQGLYDSLVGRPKAASDFVSGTPAINVGDTVAFGQDIGFNSNNSCTANEGFGYWPPGPSCPEDTSKTGSFPDTPASTSDACDTGLGPIGFYVNGVSVYNWKDGQSYNNAGIWNNSAAVAEKYDVDICGGHAAGTDYHHHFYSACLANTVGDNADGHSPIYGFAADGYPIHGPWFAESELAQSSWQARDYDDANDPYGCGGSGARSCLMVDEYNRSSGTTSASSDGPGSDAIITTQSGNEIPGASGFYYEDYYWDETLTELGGRYLDQDNGHEHDDLGYHYHLTMSDTSGSLLPAFPYTFGPRFHGELQNGALASCDDGLGGPPGR